MERKRIDKLVAILLIGILMPVSLFPFRIDADTITNSNVNINYYLESVTEVSSGSYMQTYRVEFVFDQSYLGWISSKMVGTYVSNNTVPVTTSQFTKTQAIYVNGVTAETSFTFVTPNNMNGGALQSLSQSIQNSNVTPLADLSTLDDILNVLNDINNNVEIDVIEELQNIVANTSLANNYLQTISKIRQYNIPIESLIPIIYNIKNNNSRIVDLYNYGYFQYPIFNYQTGDNMFTYYFVNSNTYDFIFISLDVSLNSANEFKNFFTIDNIDVNSYVTLYNASGIGIYKLNLSSSVSGNRSIIIKNGSRRYIPVYFGNHDRKYISNEFALTFGLSNSLLDNIQTIVDGTTQSNSASGSLDQATSQFSDDANDLVTIEESFNNSMNQSLQSVNPTFNMGSSFLTSANWVSQQFNRIVNNTPFASLITFGLTLGLGLLIIGKVRK